MSNNIYNFEIKKQAVLDNLNNGIPMNQIGKRLNTNAATIYQWIEKYKKEGDAGLRRDGRGKAKLHPSVKIVKDLSLEEQVVEMKKEIEYLKKFSVLLEEKHISPKAKNIT